MSALNVSLELADDRRHYRPGDTIEATIRLESAMEWEVLYAELAFFWRTSGRGTQNEGLAGIERPARKGERVDVGTVERTFSFRVPTLPQTYRGRVMKVEWYVGFYVRGDGAPGSEIEIPIVVHTDPERFATLDAIEIGKGEA